MNRDVTAHGINALATWMLEHPLVESTDSSIESSAASGADTGTRPDAGMTVESGLSPTHEAESPVFPSERNR